MATALEPRTTSVTTDEGGRGVAHREMSADGSSPQAGPVSRREFLSSVATGVAAAPLVGAALAGCTQTMSSAGKASGAKLRPGHNILFVFTDQERYFRRWPSGYTLPGRERLQQTGVAFHNHYCPATQCTPSRSVLMTGLQTPDTRMFENTDLPWIKDLSTDIPTIGHMLRKEIRRAHV